MTTYGYNEWNLQTTIVEPATIAFPDVADRTFEVGYDSGGLPVREEQPGGVVITRVFDEVGRLESESGTGDGAATRSFGYDLTGLTEQISHPSGTIALDYDGRALLESVTGPGGSAGYGYDDTGRLIQRVDAAGTATFGWTARDELDWMLEPLTGVTVDYDWNTASELATVTYGAGGAVRNYGYDDLGRVVTDTLVTPGAATVMSLGYDYDADSNIETKTVVLPGNADAGVHEYGYDQAGRLTSWTHDSTVTDYTWDDAGNRLTAGTDTYEYDSRNRLTTGPDSDYTYTPRGTLVSVDDSVTSHAYDFDSLGRLSSYDGVNYTYDSLDRVAVRDTQSFTYTGVNLDPTTDGTHTYSRTPGGNLTAIDNGTTALLTGRDRHGDLNHLHTPAGVITDTALYDPFGDPLTSTGTFNPQVGYQGDYTDPASGHVWMGARWYDTSTAGFVSRDTIFGELRTPVTLNRYTYANNNPLTYWDPNGRMAQSLPDGIYLGPGSPFHQAQKSGNTATQQGGSTGYVAFQAEQAAAAKASIAADMAAQAQATKSHPEDWFYTTLGVLSPMSMIKAALFGDDIGYVTQQGQGMWNGFTTAAGGLWNAATHPIQTAETIRRAGVDYCTRDGSRLGTCLTNPIAFVAGPVGEQIVSDITTCAFNTGTNGAQACGALTFDTAITVLTAGIGKGAKGLASMPRHHAYRATTPGGVAGGGNDVVRLYRAPQRGQATGPLNPADFPGRGGAVPDGRAYFSPDRQVAEMFEKSYGNGIIRVDIPRASYDRMLRTLNGVQDAGAFPFQGGPFTEAAIPRWMIPWVNRFPMGPG